MRRLFAFVLVLGLVSSLGLLPVQAEEFTLKSGEVVISHEVNSSPADWSAEDCMSSDPLGVILPFANRHIP